MHFLFCPVFFRFCFFHAQALGADIYVSPGAAGDGSIGNPVGLQTALDTARTNGQDDTLFLQQGTYDASTAGANTFEYGAASNDNKAVILRGGWNADFTHQSDDPALTILDGGNDAPVLHILADATGVSFDFEIDRLTIQHGLSTDSHGAGIRAYNGTLGNSGAVNLVIRNSVIRDNDATDSYVGGALYSSAYFEIHDTVFSSNTAASGGALYVNDVPGGDKSLSPLVDHCIFDGNIVVGWQGSSIFNNVSLRVKDSTFKNTSGRGSPIHSHVGSSLHVSNSVFAHNRIFGWGSAIGFWDAGGSIVNSLFYDNVAGDGGNGYGAVSYYDPAGGPGPANISILNSNFTHNSDDGTTSAAIHNRGATMTIVNSLFGENEGTSGLYSQYGVASISYSGVQFGAYGGFSDGGHNIDANPQYVNTSGPPATWDLHLQAGSPAMDKGNNAAPGLAATDLDGKSRINDGDLDGTATVNMGAYEFAPPIAYQVTTTSDTDCSDFDCSLQAALDAAEIDGTHSLLKLAEGTYTGNFEYLPAAGRTGDLSIEGGYAADFNSRDVNPTNTVLDSQGTGQVLRIAMNEHHNSGAINVEGITVQNGNNTVSDGAGLMAFTEYPGTLTINRNIFANNSVRGSGAAFMGLNVANNRGNDVRFTNNIVYGNSSGTATDGGGAVFVNAVANTLIANNLIHDNVAGVSGQLGGSGAGLAVVGFGGQVHIANNTIVGNTAYSNTGDTIGYGGGVLLGAHPTLSFSPSDFVLVNNIIHGNSQENGHGEDIYNRISNAVPAAGNTLSVSFTDVSDLDTAADSVTPTLASNIDLDPQLSPGPKTGYFPISGSPVIDAGDNTDRYLLDEDLATESRPQDGNGDGTDTVNMGAYEIIAYALNVSMAGTGNGAVSSPSGIDCGGTCEAGYEYGEVIQLTAVADYASSFASWSGDACQTVNANMCDMSMTANKAVVANFDCLTELPEETGINETRTYGCSDIRAINGFVVLAPDGNVTFTAKTGIQLGAGFVVQSGALFRAVID